MSELEEMREAIQRDIDFLISEAEEEMHRETIDRLHTAENKLEKIRWQITADMYRAIEEISDCCSIGIAIGKLQLCHKLQFIPTEIFKELITYLNEKEREEKEYKKMYYELLEYHSRHKSK